MHIVIPALNEEQAIGKVIASIRGEGFHRITVVDNGSTDRTRAIAEAAGARVIIEPRRGYGAACQAGIASLDGGAGDIIVFVDADGSDDTRDLVRLLDPLDRGVAELVLGSRTLGSRERGALPAHARLGNWLATTLIRWRTGVRYTDLGPLRALRMQTLRRLDMQDMDFGWTVEMQLKAARARMNVVEVPVGYRKRIGQSKISGTLRGSVRAGVKILTTIARYGG